MGNSYNSRGMDVCCRMDEAMADDLLVQKIVWSLQQLWTHGSIVLEILVLTYQFVLMPRYLPEEVAFLWIKDESEGFLGSTRA